VKTDNAVFIPNIVDVVTAETGKFFSEKSLNGIDDFSDIKVDYFGGKQSGLEAALFSACAFRSAAADKQSDAAVAKRADAAAEYLSTQPHLAACGRVKSENGYINIYFSDEYLHKGIEYYAKQFDILFEKDVFVKYCYDRQTAADGLRRYCINRIISVCEMFGGKYGKIGTPSVDFTSKLQRNLAEHCVFALGSESVSGQCAKRLSEFAAHLFYEADSCIKNASMIYLNLYKTCAYTLHRLFIEEGIH